METIRKKLEELPDIKESGLKERKEVYDSNYEKAKEHNEKLDDGLQIGKIVYFSVADGQSVFYEIAEIGEDISKVNYIPELNPDGFKPEAVDREGNVLTSNLERAASRVDSSLGSL